MQNTKGIINNISDFGLLVATAGALTTAMGCASGPTVTATQAPAPITVAAVEVEDEPVIVEETSPADPAWDGFVDARLSYLQQLAEPLVECTDNAALPHAQSDYSCTTRDWPSLMQAAYGLARIARRTNNPELAQSAVDAVSPQVLDSVRTSLTQYGVQEDPHAFVWVLAAATEHPSAQPLQEIAAEVAGALEIWLSELPEEDVMHGVLVGSRDSVAWITQNVWQWARANDRPELAQRLAQFTETQLGAQELDQFCDSTIDGEPTSAELFPPCLHRVSAVLTVLPGDKSGWLSSLAENRRHLDPVENAPLATHAALNFSRSASLWALYEATGEPALKDAYVRHIQAQMQSTRWGQHHAADRAWVAQFGVQAIELSFPAQG